MTGTLRNKTFAEEVSVVWLHPKQSNGRVVVWLDNQGKAAVRNERVIKLVKGGTTVLGADLIFQGSEPVTQARVVANKREFAGYSHGYNHSLFAQRTHDVLTLVTFLRNGKIDSHPSPSPKSVAVAGWGGAGPIVAAARFLAGKAIDRATVDTGGFRFSKLLDYRDPMFLPGGAKYFDLPGMIALSAPHPLWLTGEGAMPDVSGVKFSELTVYGGEATQMENSAIEWMQKK
jgi:hypothetical protein